jgi:hypothetical protein
MLEPEGYLPFSGFYCTWPLPVFHLFNFVLTIDNALFPTLGKNSHSSKKLYYGNAHNVLFFGERLYLLKSSTKLDCGEEMRAIIIQELSSSIYIKYSC